MQSLAVGCSSASLQCSTVSRSGRSRRLLFETRRQSTLRDRMAAVFGEEAAGFLQPFEAELSLLLLPSPAATTAQARQQIRLLDKLLELLASWVLVLALDVPP